MTNAHSETGQMAVCCRSLTLGALSSLSALSLPVGALFKKFGPFMITPRSENTTVFSTSSIIDIQLHVWALCIGQYIGPKHVAVTNVVVYLLYYSLKIQLCSDCMYHT